MKLQNRSHFKFIEQYTCQLTETIDTLANLDTKNSPCFYHYIMADKDMLQNKCLAICVPGGTIGDIYIDDNNNITKIFIATNYIIRNYPDDINEILKEFIGQKIEL